MRDRIQILEKDGLYAVRLIRYSLWVIPFYEYVAVFDGKIHYSDSIPYWSSLEKCKEITAMLKAGFKQITRVYEETLL